MPSTLELCGKYFGTRDIYKLMNLPENAIEKDGKQFIYITKISIDLLLFYSQKIVFN